MTVFQVGRHDGVEFMVMERLYGDTLESRIDEAKERDRELPLQEVLDLLIGIADALSTAHALGIAQRDLKPSNILVCGERVVLIDMGLFVPEVLVAPENEAAGSAEYMAPEVLLRTVQKGRGPLIDLYALGVIAYELLTNKTPFAAESRGSVLAKHVGAPVPDVAELRPEVPRALSALVTELLSKDPAGRPSSAEAVLWQLRDVRASGVRQSKSMRILAVDDEEHVGLSLKRSLESEFPQVHVEPTTNPMDAIEQSRHAAADVVLVDLNMPKHNGIEVCMSLLALPARLRPIVVGMSAQATSADIAVLRSLGVRHFVPKDADFVTVMSHVIRDVRSGGPPPSQR